MRHLRLARAMLPNADIRVLRHHVCNFIPEYANGSFFNLDDAIEFAPQLAVIANPAPFHLSVACALAGIGTHILVEKPISDSLEGVAQLIDICRSKKSVLMVGYNLRFLPSLQQFRYMLNQDAFGAVLSVRCEIGQYLPTWRPDTDYRKTVSAQRKLGGGALLELSHEIDYLRWIFGEIEWVKSTLSQQSNLEVDVEDTVHLILGFTGPPGSKKIIAAVNLDFIRHDTVRMCTAICEKGSLRWNGLTGVIDCFEAGGEVWHECFRNEHQRDDSYLAEWHHFLSCINNKTVPLITGEDGLKVLQIIDAARRGINIGNQACIIDNQLVQR